MKDNYSTHHYCYSNSWAYEESYSDKNQVGPIRGGYANYQFKSRILITLRIFWSLNHFRCPIFCRKNNVASYLRALPFYLHGHCSSSIHKINSLQSFHSCIYWLQCLWCTWNGFIMKRSINSKGLNPYLAVLRRISAP